MVGSDRIELNQQRAALDDANYLLGVLESKSSGKAKYKAARNLESLGIELNNYIGNGRRNRPVVSTVAAERTSRFRAVISGPGIERALDRIQVDDGRQRVTNSDDSRSLRARTKRSRRLRSSRTMTGCTVAMRWYQIPNRSRNRAVSAGSSTSS
ncbi:MAG: hypothetical protein Ct9H300mP1_13630 [Planctomycetaceae bacterium]|nr:MAG: hypothetical protein Ct9H300mP1_13630 [Planctomycetaceae bacterium]